MRKKLIILMICVFLFVFTGIVFAGGSGEVGQINIGMCIADFDDTFMQYLMDAAKAEGKSLGVNLVLADGKSDPQTQLSQVENFVTQGFDAVIIHAVNTTAVDAMSDAVLNAGIKLVYVNRFPTNFPDSAIYVGSDDYDAGRQQAEYFVELLGGQGNVVILEGTPGSDPAIKRTAAVEDIVARTEGSMKVVRKQTANFRRADAMQVMENWIISREQIDVVAANNDEMAIGAIMALQEAGMKDQVMVFGVDATPDALQFMADGQLDGSVFQNAEAQGAGSVEAAYKSVKGEAVESEIWIPFDLVTPDNYKDYQK